MNISDVLGVKCLQRFKLLIKKTCLRIKESVGERKGNLSVGVGWSQAS